MASREAPPDRRPLWVVVAAVCFGIAAIAAFALSHRRQAVKPRPVIRVVIPEGFNRLQIAEVARGDGVRGSYLEATAKPPPFFNPARYGAPPNLPNLEGFLFPATYYLYAGSSASELVAKQLEAFQERFSPALFAAARALGLTPYQLLIVASMVEKEAGTPHDRPLIAAVIYNRLRQGMPLGIDATIRYALNDLSGPLTERQLHTESPYNTRLHPGLPPTPIANPGLESLEAAAHPAHVPYLYYVASPSGCGESLFAVTYAEFERDVAAYDRAVAANGGKPPVCHR